MPLKCDRHKPGRCPQRSQGLCKSGSQSVHHRIQWSKVIGENMGDPNSDLDNPPDTDQNNSLESSDPGDPVMKQIDHMISEPQVYPEPVIKLQIRQNSRSPTASADESESSSSRTEPAPGSESNPATISDSSDTDTETDDEDTERQLPSEEVTQVTRSCENLTIQSEAHESSESEEDEDDFEVDYVRSEAWSDIQSSISDITENISKIKEMNLDEPEKQILEDEIVESLRDIDSQMSKINESDRDEVRAYAREVAAEMEISNMNKVLHIQANQLGLGNAQADLAEDMVRNSFFSRPVENTIKTITRRLVMTRLMLFFSVWTVGQASKIDNKIFPMYVNSTSMVRLFHPMSSINVMTFSESHSVENFNVIIKEIDSLIYTARELADFSIENKICSTKRANHAPAESAVIIQMSEQNPDKVYALPHLEITSDVYKYESFVQNGTCRFRFNPDLAKILGESNSFRYHHSTEWWQTGNAPIFDYTERNVEVEDREKRSQKGVCKFYDFYTFNDPSVMKSYYQEDDMPITKLMGCLTKCQADTRCLYSGFNHHDNKCYLYARVIQEHELYSMRNNYFYQQYFTIISPSCTFSALDRTRPYLMINGTMVNLFDTCEFIDNEKYFQIHYQCTAFYEPVIQELEQNKQLLKGYKKELAKKFTPVARSTKSKTEISNTNTTTDNPQSATREKRGLPAASVVIPFIFQIAKIIGKNFGRIHSITSQVSKYTTVSMPRIKTKVVEEGFKSSLNSDISYYTIERPDTTQIQRVFDFTFDTKLIHFHRRLNQSFKDTYGEIERFKRLLEDSAPIHTSIESNDYLFTRYFDRDENALIRNFIYTKYEYNPYRLEIQIPYNSTVLQPETWSVHSDYVVGKCIEAKTENTFDGTETSCLASNAAKTQISEEIFILRVKDKLFPSTILVVNSANSAIRAVCPHQEIIFPVKGFSIIATGSDCHTFRGNVLITRADDGISMIQPREIWDNELLYPATKQIENKHTVSVDKTDDVVQYVLIALLSVFQIAFAFLCGPQVMQKLAELRNKEPNHYQVVQAWRDNVRRLSRMHSRRSSPKRTKAMEEGIAPSGSREPREPRSLIERTYDRKVANDSEDLF